MQFKKLLSLLMAGLLIFSNTPVVYAKEPAEQLQKTNEKLAFTKDDVIDWRYSTSERGLYSTPLTQEYKCRIYQGETPAEVLSMYKDKSLDMPDIKTFFDTSFFRGISEKFIINMYKRGVSFDDLESVMMEYLSDLNKQTSPMWTWLKNYVNDNFPLKSSAYSISSGTSYSEPESTGSASSGPNNTSYTLIGHYASSYLQNDSAGWTYDSNLYINGGMAFCAQPGRDFDNGKNYSVDTDPSVPYYVDEAIGYWESHRNNQGHRLAQLWIWAEGDQDYFETIVKENNTKLGTSLPTSVDFSDYSASGKIYYYYPTGEISHWQAVWSMTEPNGVKTWRQKAWAWAKGTNKKTPMFQQSIVLKKIATIGAFPLNNAVFKIEIIGYNGAGYNSFSSPSVQNEITGTDGTIACDFGYFVLGEIQSSEQSSTNSLHTVSIEWEDGEMDEDDVLGELLSEANAKKTDAINEVKGKIDADLVNKETEAISNASITYRVTEISSPDGFNNTFGSRDITIKGSGTGTNGAGNLGNITNEPWKAKISIAKVDSVYNKNITANATFTLYEYNGANYVVSPNFAVTRLTDGTYSVKCINPAYTATDGWLYYTTTNQGRFYIEETTAPSGFHGDYEDLEAKNKHKHYITLTKEIDGQTLYLTSNINDFVTESGTFANVPTTGTLKFYKKDADADAHVEHGDASLDGAVYDIYVKEDIKSSYDNNVLATFKGSIFRDGEWIEETTNCAKDALIASGVIANGSFIISELPIGQYYVKERVKKTTNAGDISYAPGYLVDNNIYEFEIKYYDEYASVEIVTSPEDLANYPGEYYIDEDTVYHVTGQNVISHDQVIKSSMVLTKLTKSTIDKESRVLPGAGFTLYRIAELSKADSFTKDSDGKWDINSVIEAYKTNDGFDFSNEPVAKRYYKDGEETKYETFPETFSNEDGIMEIKDIPYGQYVCVETTVPENVLAVEPFLVDINEDSKPALKMRYLTDNAFEADIKILKTDAETGKEVLVRDTEFEIYDSNGEKVSLTDKFIGLIPVKVDTFKTNEYGIIHLPQPLPVGDYTIREVQAPEGYYNRSIVDGYAYELKIDPAMIYNEADDIVKTEDVIIKINKFENHETLGVLQLQKTGDVIVGYNDETGFILENLNIPGASFEVKATEDINAPDKQTAWYKKGDVVANINIGGESTYNLPDAAKYDFMSVSESDNVVSLTLPLGKYTVTETSPPHGYVLKDESKTVEFKWTTQEEKTVLQKLEINNERVKSDIQLHKSDTDDESISVKGAKYGLFAAENIASADGELLVSSDQKLAEGITDDDGIIIFDLPLPEGKYYIKEMEAPQGYLINPDKLSVDFSISDIHLATARMSIETSDRKAGIFVKKIDAKDRIIEGTKLAITDEGGNVLKEWISSADGDTITSLPFDTKLYLKEVTPASGYVSAEPIEFMVVQTEDDCKLVSPQDTSKPKQLVMTDDYTKLQISKKDIATSEELEGATLSVKNASGKTLYTWKSGSDGKDENGKIKPHLIEYLPIGKYTLVEQQAPEGYAVAEAISFEITDTGKVQSCVMLDNYDLPKGGGGEEFGWIKTGDVFIGLLVVLLFTSGSVIVAVIVYRKRIE